MTGAAGAIGPDGRTGVEVPLPLRLLVAGRAGNAAVDAEGSDELLFPLDADAAQFADRWAVDR